MKIAPIYTIQSVIRDIQGVRQNLFLNKTTHWCTMLCEICILRKHKKLLYMTQIMYRHQSHDFGILSKFLLTDKNSETRKINWPRTFLLFLNFCSLFSLIRKFSCKRSSRSNFQRQFKQASTKLSLSITSLALACFKYSCIHI